MPPTNGVRDNRQPVNLAEVKPGDVLEAASQEKLPPGMYAVLADSEGDLYVDGGRGRVYLEHAAREDGTLAGFRWGAFE